MPDERVQWVALARICGDAGGARALVDAFGSPDEIFGASEERLAAHAPRPLARRLAAGPDLAAARNELEWARNLGLRCLPLDATDYPPLLRELGAPPLALYVRGELPRGPALAMVGSRKATPRARQLARDWARDLARAGACIVSGLALGVDAQAHRGALDARGLTVAVLASGLDRPSPPSNRRLADEILDAGGAWLSEHAPGVRSLPHHFPRRNRIISGLARAVLIVEAREASGSLWTARHAIDQGRELLVVPGPVDTDACRGSNALLRDGAAPVIDVDDLLYAVLQRDRTHVRAPSAPKPDQDPLLAALAQGPCDVDALGRALGLAADALAERLLDLELAGSIRRSGARVSLAR